MNLVEPPCFATYKPAKDLGFFCSDCELVSLCAATVRKEDLKPLLAKIEKIQAILKEA